VCSVHCTALYAGNWQSRVHFLSTSWTWQLNIKSYSTRYCKSSVIQWRNWGLHKGRDRPISQEQAGYRMPKILLYWNTFSCNINKKIKKRSLPIHSNCHLKATELWMVLPLTPRVELTILPTPSRLRTVIRPSMFLIASLHSPPSPHFNCSCHPNSNCWLRHWYHPRPLKALVTALYAYYLIHTIDINIRYYAIDFSTSYVKTE